MSLGELEERLDSRNGGSVFGCVDGATVDAGQPGFVIGGRKMCLLVGTQEPTCPANLIVGRLIGGTGVVWGVDRNVFRVVCYPTVGAVLILSFAGFGLFFLRRFRGWVFPWFADLGSLNANSKVPPTARLRGLDLACGFIRVVPAGLRR